MCRFLNCFTAIKVACVIAVHVSVNVVAIAANCSQ